MDSEQPGIITINKRRIGPGLPVYLVAELSANHAQDYSRAVKLIEVAKQAGADAVKLQTYTADTITIDCNEPCFRIQGTIWAGRTLHDLYREAAMPWQWHQKLQKAATNIGLDFFSTPFDATAVAFLETMDVPAYKIASFEMVDTPLLERIAATKKPVIMSTGMATCDEITEAVRVLRSAGCRELALLKCTSAYPAALEDMNLRTISHMAETFKVPTGLSDHSMSTAVPVAAVSLGACIIEKHFTLSRDIPGPDSPFSLEPREFQEMVAAVRDAEKALGSVSYKLTESEKTNRVFRRSLFVVKDMRAGDRFSEENVRSIRPGNGMHPRYLKNVLGRQASTNIKRGTPLIWDLVGRR